MRSIVYTISTIIYIITSLIITICLAQQEQNDYEAVLASIESTLHEYEEIASMQVPEEFDEIEYELISTEESIDDISNLRKEIDDIINNINKNQIEVLINRLEEIAKAEKTRRDKEEEEKNNNNTTMANNNNATATTIDNEDDKNNNKTTIVEEEVKEMLDTEKILQQPENELIEWIESLIDEEINEYITNQTTILEEKQQQQEENKKKLQQQKHEIEPKCVTITEVAQEVQVSLDQYRLDGIGRYDLLQMSGTTIINQYTSKTYNNNVITSTSTKQYTLGQYFRKYIPEDIENLLTYYLHNEWEEWYIIPDYIINLILSNNNVSNNKMIMAPVEAIIQPSNLPGHCWAIPAAPTSTTDDDDDENNNTPQTVMIRLAKPSRVDSITIDHASSLLVEKDQRNSAPKAIKVYGYETCKVCDLGFDLSSKFLIADILYDIDGESNVQTFMVKTENELISDTSSCSATSPSCGNDEEISEAVEIAAMSVEILENWGNPDYTCLYRVRIHGEPIDNR